MRAAVAPFPTRKYLAGDTKATEDAARNVTAAIPVNAIALADDIAGLREVLKYNPNRSSDNSGQRTETGLRVSKLKHQFELSYTWRVVAREHIGHMRA